MLVTKQCLMVFGRQTFPVCTASLQAGQGERGQGERRLWERDCVLRKDSNVHFRDPLSEVNASRSHVPALTSLSTFSLPDKNNLSLCG